MGSQFSLDIIGLAPVQGQAMGVVSPAGWTWPSRTDPHFRPVAARRRLDASEGHQEQCQKNPGALDNLEHVVKAAV